MEVVTIEQAQEEAKVEWKEYCKAIRENIPNDAEYMRYYKSIKNALYYLSQGKKIIDLEESMRAAGLDEQGNPKIAIMRAHVNEVFFEWDWRLGGIFFERHRVDRWWHTQRYKIPVDSSLFDRGNRPHSETYSTVVPKVPARFLPKHPLENYYILWEVEKWTKASKPPVPPGDPMLLKRITGNPNLYAVLAMWDLTKLERAVLRGAIM